MEEEGEVEDEEEEMDSTRVFERNLQHYKSRRVEKEERREGDEYHKNDAKGKDEDEKGEEKKHTKNSC